MPIKHGIWTVDEKPAPLVLTKLATEQQFEDMIVADPRVQKHRNIQDITPFS